jgi:hypothetical protein
LGGLNLLSAIKVFAKLYITLAGTLFFIGKCEFNGNQYGNMV